MKPLYYGMIMVIDECVFSQWRLFRWLNKFRFWKNAHFYILLALYATIDIKENDSKCLYDRQRTKWRLC